MRELQKLFLENERFVFRERIKITSQLEADERERNKKININEKKQGTSKKIKKENLTKEQNKADDYLESRMKHFQFYVTMKKRAELTDASLGTSSKIFDPTSRIGFFKDPAFEKNNIVLFVENYEQLKKDQNLQEKNIISEMEKRIPDSGIIIFRNLYLSGKTPTKENIKQEVYNFFKTRECYKDLDIFKDRNIRFISNSDKQLYYEDRFGNEELVNALKIQNGKSFQHLESTGYTFSGNDIKETKEKILQLIIETPPPFTFYFQGHGADDTIGLLGPLDGMINSIVSLFDKTQKQTISVDEMVEALRKRAENFKNEKYTDIFIFASCESSNYIRNIYSKIKGKMRMPIFIAQVEYGQYAVEDHMFTKQKNNTFNRTVTKASTFGDFYKYATPKTSGNPCIYFPSYESENMLQQGG